MNKKGQTTKPTAGDILVYKDSIFGFVMHTYTAVLVDVYGTLYKLISSTGKVQVLVPYIGHPSNSKITMYTPKKRYNAAEKNVLTKAATTIVALMEDTKNQDWVRILINKVRPNTISTGEIVADNTYYKVKQA